MQTCYLHAHLSYLLSGVMRELAASAAARPAAAPPPEAAFSLFSPPLDFSGIPGAELTFDAFRDADGFGDTATIRFVRVGDDSLLGAEIPIDMAIFDTDYTNLSVPVPAEAIGESARIEFNFVSDGTLDAFSGLSIDNVIIEVAAP